MSRARPLESEACSPGLDNAVLSPDTPIQVQIYRHLRNQILDGEWILGEDIPVERELAAQFGVALISVRVALERLAREGLLARSRGRGTRASYSLTPARPKVTPSTMSLIVGASDRHFTLVKAREARAPSAACRAFGLDPGATLWECVRVWERDNLPHALFQIFQRPEVGKRHARKLLDSATMATILRGEGIEIASVRRSVRAVTGSLLAARHLGLHLDVPLLEVTAQLFDISGQLIEWSRGYLHPDRISIDELLPLEIWTPSEERATDPNS